MPKDAAMYEMAPSPHHIEFTPSPKNAHTAREKAAGHATHRSAKSCSDTSLYPLSSVRRTHPNPHPQLVLNGPTMGH